MLLAESHWFVLFLHFTEISSTCGECWPLDYQSKSLILKNYSKIASILDSGDDLITEMLSQHCLTLNQLIVIENINDRCERTKKLLDILLKGSRGTLKLFLRCLEKTQRHLVSLMTEEDTGNLRLVEVAMIDNYAEKSLVSMTS